MTARPLHDRCDSCPAAVFWADTDRGAAMLVDAQPLVGGNLRLTKRPERRPLVTTVKAKLAFGQTLYRAHFASCPHAAEHRKRRSAS